MQGFIQCNPRRNRRASSYFPSRGHSHNPLRLRALLPSNTPSPKPNSTPHLLVRTNHLLNILSSQREAPLLHTSSNVRSHDCSIIFSRRSTTVNPILFCKCKQCIYRSVLVNRSNGYCAIYIWIYQDLRCRRMERRKQN